MLALDWTRSELRYKDEDVLDLECEPGGQHFYDDDDSYDEVKDNEVVLDLKC